MEPALVIDLGTRALMLVILISGPMLLAGLAVGLGVGVFQAVTQIHEMTLTFIPKILAILGTLLLLMPWMITKLVTFTVGIMEMIPLVVK